MWSRPRVRALLVMVVLALAIVSIVILVAGGVGASPSLTSSIRIGNFGEVNYYASQPMPNVPPGILIRVFLINGSVVEPVRAFIDVYANAQSGIVHVSMGYSPILIVPFSNVNWRYAIDRWASLNVPFSEYETSMLIFITYVKGNESWILPLVIPYNVAWVIENSRYMVVNAFINVNELRPSRVVPVRLNSTVMDPQVFGTYYNYTIYNCSLSGPKPPQYPSAPTSLYMFKPTSDCIGINGSLPIAWVTWSNGVIQNDQGLQVQLIIDFSGTIDWDAMATGYGDIGTSYSANENWNLAFLNAVQLGSEVTQPGSVYWYYGGATWAIVNYTVWYVDTNTGITYYEGTTLVSEVLYVPPYDTNVNPAFDYGNGTISMLYNGAITLSQQYFGYPALNASSVVDYAEFEGGSYADAPWEVAIWECNGPVYVNTGASGTYYTITLGGVETAYSLSTAEIGTELGGLAFDILVGAATGPEAGPLIEFLSNVGSAIFDIASLLIPPQTSSTVTQTTLEIGGVTNSTILYISVINATAVYGLPTFGFILNATNYYGNPTTYTCKYNQVTRIG